MRGHSEVIDFVVVLLGYAIRGQDTLQAFSERLSPFGSTFMALCGRDRLPDRSTLSRFLAAVDPSCLEAFRTQFEKSFGQGWSQASIGGVWDRQGQRHVVFDVDATRQPARQRALPKGEELPAARRRLEQVCAPGYLGRKRGEVVRTVMYSDNIGQRGIGVVTEACAHCLKEQARVTQGRRAHAQCRTMPRVTGSLRVLLTGC